MKNLFILLFTFVSNITLSQNTILVTQAKSPVNYLWGYINIEGHFIIEPKYEKCMEFASNGLALVRDEVINDWRIIRLNGQLFFLKDNEVRFNDYATGTTGILNLIRVGFNDGLLQVSKNSSWGFANSKGEIAVPIKYKEVGIFNKGYTWAENKDKVFFVIDSLGNEKEIAVDGLSLVRNFSEGFAPIMTKDKNVGFINTDGEITIKPQFDNVGYFRNGLAWARSLNQLVGFIDKSGKWIIYPQFQEAHDFDLESGLARVKANGYWFYVNRDNEKLVVNTTNLFGDFCEGLAMGRLGKQYGFFDNQGNWVIPPQFEGVRDFKNGYAAAKKFGKWGIIDKRGDWVIVPTFAAIKDMELVKK